MILTIPESSLVLLIGASGSGKSSFARQHFKPTEVISSDFCRGLVSDDENDQTASEAAFDVLRYIAAKRLQNLKLTVIDATNVQSEARRVLVELAREYHVQTVAIILDVPEKICRERNQSRPDRQFGEHVIANQRSQLRRSLRGLQREGFRHVYHLSSVEAIDSAEISFTRLWNNLRHDHGPFDIIGDIHGCFDELVSLLERLGYQVNDQQVTAPAGRKAIFLGDLVDRGPKVPQVLRLVMGMVEAGIALCVPGNHDVKLVKKLAGKQVQLKHGLAETMQQLEGESPTFLRQVQTFLDGLISHYVLDEGRLVVAHAGMREDLMGRASGRVREFALYGETTGETDEFGLPVRYPWAEDYRGRSRIVYGHTPVPTAEWLNNTINIDTGCVFGGQLTALQYPELTLVAVPALQPYAQPIRPLIAAPDSGLSSQQVLDEYLEMEDVSGKRRIQTRLLANITLQAPQCSAALEVMSRFAVNPKWLIYLPPTMSPVETSPLPDLLEHPREALAYYQQHGVAQVICEEKHMGSRAIVMVCRDEGVAQARFGLLEPSLGICYTRTGRRFFDDPALEAGLLERLREALVKAGTFQALASDWVCLDCELMPWSAKAQGLLRHQYAAVGAAGRASLGMASNLLQQAQAQGREVSALLEATQQRAHLINAYTRAYGHYCWEVSRLDDLTLAPFHLMASEGAVHIHQTHQWHMEMIAQLCRQDEALLLATPYKIADTNDESSQQAVIEWWESLTEQGGEGMVVKPLEFIATGPRGWLQPAIKVRGKEYLRIIYGPEYSDHLPELRRRGLGSKRSLALREFALGIEALERFVRREPLRKIHECVFGVLALESDPMDPRL